ncbi:MarR family winged helix-turn-helix transcriptional regulator [Chloroflexota bacterium]
MIDIVHEDLTLRSFMLFMQTARAVAKYSDSCFFQVSRLSTAKYIVLKALKVNGGSLKHVDLANWTDTEPHNITALVRRMKAEGLVTTERSDDDKRVIYVRSTEKGSKLFEEAAPMARGIMAQVMSGISKKEAAQLEKLLKALKANTPKVC